MSDEPQAPAGSIRPRPSTRRDRALAFLLCALTAVVVMTASAVLARSLRRWREGPGPQHPGDAARATSAVRPDPRAVLRDAGRLAYQVHCARCHGAEGHGDGSDAERLRPPPRDFAADGWRHAPDADSVRRTIVEGIPDTAMPGWGQSLSRRELDGLVAQVLAMAHKPGDAGEGGVGDGDETLPSELVALLDRAGFAAESTPRPAPSLALRDLDGRATTLDGGRGRATLLLFWGTTCGPCISELPEVVEFADRQRDRGLDVLPICIDERDRGDRARRRRPGAVPSVGLPRPRRLGPTPVRRAGLADLRAHRPQGPDRGPCRGRPRLERPRARRPRATGIGTTTVILDNVETGGISTMGRH